MKAYLGGEPCEDIEFTLVFCCKAMLDALLSYECQINFFNHSALQVWIDHHVAEYCQYCGAKFVEIKKNAKVGEHYPIVERSPSPQEPI